MEARLLADEHFDVEVVAALSSKGHDIVTVRRMNQNKRGDGWTDEDVLRIAKEHNRVLLTDNIKDFRKLHRSMHWHEGIVACASEHDAQAKADRIDQLLRDAMDDRRNHRLTGLWIDARPSGGNPGYPAAR
jgi:hypothetical protein